MKITSKAVVEAYLVASQAPPHVARAFLALTDESDSRRSEYAKLAAREAVELCVSEMDTLSPLVNLAWELKRNEQLPQALKILKTPEAVEALRDVLEEEASADDHTVGVCTCDLRAALGRDELPPSDAEEHPEQERARAQALRAGLSQWEWDHNKLMPMEREPDESD